MYGKHLRFGILTAVAVSITGNAEFYSKGGAGKAAEHKEKAHPEGVDPKHVNPGVAAEARNESKEPGDHKVTEPGKDVGKREANEGGDAKAEAKESKSIVPAKYAGKYKGGGSDPLAKFLTEHSAHPETKSFDFDRYFGIMHKNGVGEEHTKPFAEKIAAKEPGAEGRARMTLRNRLDTIVRKNGHVVGLDDKKHPIALEPRAARPAKEPVAA